MIALFDSNLAFCISKIKTANLFYIFLFRKLCIFFEFDPNIKTIKWFPIFQHENSIYRILFLLFSAGVNFKGD